MPGNLSVLRALRIFRLFNVVAIFRRIIGALVRAAIGASAVFGIILVVLYVSAVMSSQLFADVMPELFGNLLLSMITHFELMIGEGWGEVVRTLLGPFGPLVVLYFMVYTVIVGFILISMLIGVIVEANQGVTNEQLSADFAERLVEMEARYAEQLEAMQTEFTRQNTALARALQNGRPTMVVKTTEE